MHIFKTLSLAECRSYLYQGMQSFISDDSQCKLPDFNFSVHIAHFQHPSWQYNRTNDECQMLRGISSLIQAGDRGIPAGMGFTLGGAEGGIFSSPETSLSRSGPSSSCVSSLLASKSLSSPSVSISSSEDRHTWARFDATFFLLPLVSPVAEHRAQNRKLHRTSLSNPRYAYLEEKMERPVLLPSV